MTEQEQNMVNRLKMAVARMILDLDDEAVLEVIKKVTKEGKTEKVDDICKFLDISDKQKGGDRE